MSHVMIEDGPPIKLLTNTAIIAEIMKGESRKATRPWRFLSKALLIEATVYPAVAMAGTKYCGLPPEIPAKVPKPTVAKT